MVTIIISLLDLMGRRGSWTMTVTIMASTVGCRARVLGIFMTAISP